MSFSSLHFPGAAFFPGSGSRLLYYSIDKYITSETPRHKWTGVLIGSLAVAFAFKISASQFKGGLRPPVHRPSLRLLWHLPCYQTSQPFG